MMKGLVRFEREKVLHSSKLVVPVLLLLIYLVVSYSVGPQDILSSFAVCSNILFMLMIAMGISYNTLNMQMIDQSIIVKLDYKVDFYIAKVIMISIISMFFSVISIIIPILINIRSGFGLFDRGVTIMDVISGLVLFYLVSVCGGILGMLCNNRIMKQRDMGILVGILVGLLTIVKIPLLRSIPLLKLVIWILPPVSNLSVTYCKTSYYSVSNTWMYVVWLIIYVIIEMSIYIILMNRKGAEL